MLFSIEIWLLPAIAAGSSSYLVCLTWEKCRPASAPNVPTEIFLAALSFLMGAICAYVRNRLFVRSLEADVITMFIVGASTTFFWLLLRRYLPDINDRGKTYR
jgi:hypothetical protein